MKRLVFTLLVLFPNVGHCAFGYYKSATLAGAQSGTANSTDWPLTIALDGNVQAADADLKTVGNGGFVQNASGFDIRPYSDNTCSTPLTYELVYYQATTGKLEMHVKIPTLTFGSDTVIYLCFGDSGISTDGSSNTTWNSNYAGVWHLPNGSSLALLDSTSNGNNGTNHSGSATAGELDGGVSFVGASSQYADFGNAASLDITSNMTASAWAKSNTSGDYQIILGKINIAVGAGTYKFHIYYELTTGKLVGYLGGPAGIVTLTIATDSAFNDGAWHLVSLVFAPSSRGELYVDGVRVAHTDTGSVPVALQSNATKVTIGADEDPIFFLTGSVDEPRIMATDTTTSWITADYNSQKPSSTFITWGARTPIGGAAAAGVNKQSKLLRLED